MSNFHFSSKQRPFSGPQRLPSGLQSSEMGPLDSGFSGLNDRQKLLLQQYMSNQAIVLQLMNEGNNLLMMLNALLAVVGEMRRLTRTRIWCLDRPQVWYDTVHVLSEGEFKANFRVTKRTFAFLYDKLSCLRRQNTQLRASISV